MSSLVLEYDKKAVGPGKTEAFFMYVQNEFINNHQSLLKDIDQAYKDHINEIAIKISELEASEQRYVTAINNLKLSIDESEEQKEKIIQEKNKHDYDIEVLQRTINDSESENKKKIEIKLIEHTNAKELLETMISERKKMIDDINKEIEGYEASLQSNKEISLTLQREKIQAISSRKYKLQTIKDQYNQRKQKSELISLNSSFKVIKNSLDEVKGMIGDLQEAKKIKNKIYDYQKSIIGKKLT